MTNQDAESRLELSRANSSLRRSRWRSSDGGRAYPLGEVAAATVRAETSDPVGTPPVAGLHLQFGADASSEMVVSWHTLQPVQHPASCSGASMASSSKRSRRNR